MRIEFQARTPGRRQFRTARAAAAVVALLCAALVSGHRLITPGFLLSATQLNFTGDRPGVETAAQYVDLTNPFDADLRLDSVTLRGDAGVFRFPRNSCVGRTIGTKNNCQIGVSFVPPSPGTRTATLEVASAGGEWRTIVLIGILKPALAASVEPHQEPPPEQNEPEPTPAPAPAKSAAAPGPVAPPLSPLPPIAPPQPIVSASLAPNPVAFSSVTAGSGTERDVTAFVPPGETASPPPMPFADLQPARLDLTRMDPEHSIELRNAGDGQLTVSDTFLGGQNPEDFSLDPRSCTAASFGRNQGCTMSVIFRPDIAKREHHKISQALVTVRDNAQGSPHSIVVTGTEGSDGHKKVLMRILEGAGMAGAGYGIYEATHGHPGSTPAPKGTQATPVPVQPTKPQQTDTYSAPTANIR